MPPDRSAAVAVRAFALSRAFVWAVGVAAVLLFGLDERQSVVYDTAGLTRPGGPLAELLAAPAARWDSVWFLRIAEGGYDEARAAFFPVYPALLALTGSTVAGAVVLSAAATVAGLVVLHRLVALDHGERAAALTVALVAWFPMAGFLSAVYSEGVFLALSAGSVYAARTGRWAWAGALGALAAATRSAGLVLLVPLVVLWWRRPAAERAPAQLAWLALVPGGQLLFVLALWAGGVDPLAPFRAQEAFWGRAFAGPLGAVPDAVAAAGRGAPHLLEAGLTGEVARMDVMLLGALVLALVALAGAARRLHPAYAAYAAAALLLPLSYPVPAQPLMSLPRFLLVLWPLHLWFALWLLDRPAWAPRVALAVSAAGLAVTVALFSTWHWIA
jgi:hypothetical protein